MPNPSEIQRQFEQGPKPYSPDNPKHVRSRKRQVEREDEIVRAGYHWVMNNPIGRLVIQDILNSSGLGVNPYSPATHGTDFNCGRQEVGVRLASYLEDNFPAEFLLMEAERLSARMDTQTKDAANRTGPQGDDDD